MKMKTATLSRFSVFFLLLLSQLLLLNNSFAQGGSIEGVYNNGPLTMELTADGNYQISMRGRVAIEGRYKQAEGELHLQDTGGPMSCPEPGQYQYRLGEEGLELRAVNDPCEERGEGLSAEWEKTATVTPIAIVNGTLIDGNGGKPKKNMTVLVESGKVIDIFRSGKKDLPENVELINAKGKYITPGLIDAHVHFGTAPSESGNRHEDVVPMLKGYLHSGITSVRDMGGDARSLAWLARNAKTGEIESPNIYYSAIIAGPGFFTDERTIAASRGETPGQVAWQQAFTLDDDVKITIAKVKGAGATGIKMYAELGAEEMKALSDEAHKQDLQVWSHAYVWPALPHDAVAAGVDVLSHSGGLAAQVLRGGQSAEDFMGSRMGYMSSFLQGKQKTVDKVVQSKDFKALLKDMEKNGTILDSTVMISAGFSGGEEEEEAGPGPSGQEISEAMALALTSMAREAYKAGVLISAGTDMGQEPGEAPPLFTEMELLVSEVGMTPMEALTSATKISAMATGIDKTHGTIEKGKVADILVLAKNPVKDIRHANSAKVVLKAGKIYKK